MQNIDYRVAPYGYVAAGLNSAVVRHYEKELSLNFQIMLRMRGGGLFARQGEHATLLSWDVGI